MDLKARARQKGEVAGMSSDKLITFATDSVMGYVASRQAEATLREFSQKHDIDFFKRKRYIFKDIKAERIEKIMRSIGTPLFIYDDNDVWICENFIVEIHMNYTETIVETTFSIHCNHQEYDKILEFLQNTFSDVIADLHGIVRCEIQWYYCGSRGLDSYTLSEIIQETVHNEAYPGLESVDDFIEGYFKSTSPILILTGPPGTGKSRLIRYVVMKYGRKYEHTPNVIYTSDMKAIEKEEGFFINFRIGDFKFMVLEDIDAFLQPRKDGNEVMHKFLGASDGFLRTDSKKIIMSTNLPINEIDSALIRPGRCYAHQEFGSLHRDEAIRLARKLDEKKNWSEILTQSKYTLAEIYDAASETGSAKLLAGNRSVGFQRGGR